MLQRALNRWWRVTLNMFGPSTTKNTALYLRLGLKTRTNEERRQAFLEICIPRIEALGLSIPPRLRTPRAVKLTHPCDTVVGLPL